MGYTVAVVGATGNVGREVLNILSERNFPADEVIALASERSVGSELSYGENDVLKVENLATFNFDGVDIVLSSPGADVSAKYSPKAAAAGAVVIDNTSHYRMDPDVPLVVPEVNPQAVSDYKKKGIIANPNCSTIQLLVALKPLHDLAEVSCPESFLHSRSLGVIPWEVILHLAHCALPKHVYIYIYIYIYPGHL